MSVWLSVCLSVCLFVCLFICSLSLFCLLILLFLFTCLFVLFDSGYTEEFQDIPWQQAVGTFGYRALGGFQCAAQCNHSSATYMGEWWPCIWFLCCVSQRTSWKNMLWYQGMYIWLIKIIQIALTKDASHYPIALRTLNARFMFVGPVTIRYFQ